MFVLSTLSKDLQYFQPSTYISSDTVGIFFSLGMECQVLRLFSPYSANKVIFISVGLTTLYITWEIYCLSRSTKPILRINEKNTEDFHQEWCRMQRWRVDWEGMAKPCEGQTAWDQRQVNSEWRTDANNSFIKKWRIKPAGKIIKDVGLNISYNKERVQPTVTRRTTKRSQLRTVPFLLLRIRSVHLGMARDYSRPQISCDPFGQQRHGSRALAGARITRKRNTCPFL